MPKVKEKETSGEKSLVPIIAEDKQIVNFNAESLISQAISQKLPVDTMERLLAMRRELKAEFAKESFDRAMAKFQSECPTIKKTKEVKTLSGDIAYRYAPLESIVEQVSKPLQENGFSYSSGMELLENGQTKVKVKIKVTHELGHNEITEMTVPLGNQTKVMSNSQVVAAASTFAKRYAFCNAFGILTGDEDNDGADLPESNITPHQSPNLPNKVPTEKQAKLINDLAKQKRMSQVEINLMAKGKTPSQLIETLLNYVPTTSAVAHFDENNQVADGPLPEKKDDYSDIPF